MKWSTVAGILFAAPLALATTLNADLAERSMGSGKSVSNKSEANVIVIKEVIIIWINYGGGSATTTKNDMETPAGATHAIHTVIVGGSAGLVYTPNSISANVGDMVIFQFMSKNHSATQSAFVTPCVDLAGGFDSGFMPNINNTVVPPPQMAMQIKVSTPIWFYCRQSGHCGKGMTFSINPTANKTQAMFEQIAIAQNGTGSTAGIVNPASPSKAPPSVSAPPAGATSQQVSPPAAATSTEASPPVNPAMVSGTGTGSGSICACTCLCGVAEFPSAIQGLGGFGGMPGSIPMSAAVKL